jgi:hypothetical protein
MTAIHRAIVVRRLPIAAWLLGILVLAVAVVAWGDTWRWQLGSLTTYQVFPLFGLIAFSTMWAQYMVAAASQYLRPDAEVLHPYFRLTGFIVLAAIVLHPGLLVWQLWRDGFGLPPNSYLQHYVAPGLHLAAVVGTVSLLLFLAYELRRKLGDRPWWRYMDYLVDLAMLAILYHALRLGTQTQGGWFRGVWFFYGATLAAALAYKYVESYRLRLTRNNV